MQNQKSQIQVYLDTPRNKLPIETLYSRPKLQYNKKVDEVVSKYEKKKHNNIIQYAYCLRMCQASYKNNQNQNNDNKNVEIVQFQVLKVKILPKNDKLLDKLKKCFNIFLNNNSPYIQDYINMQFYQNNNKRSEIALIAQPYRFTLEQFISSQLGKKNINTIIPLIVKNLLYAYQYILYLCKQDILKKQFHMQYFSISLDNIIITQDYNIKIGFPGLFLNCNRSMYNQNNQISLKMRNDLRSIINRLIDQLKVTSISESFLQQNKQQYMEVDKQMDYIKERLSCISNKDSYSDASSWKGIDTKFNRYFLAKDDKNIRQLPQRSDQLTRKQ